MNRTRIAVLIVAAYLFAAGAYGAEAIDRASLGGDVKLTILVDKVMQPENKWVTAEWMIKEAAEAGFNVYSPRVGHDRLKEVAEVTKWCETYGIYHMPWMRGTRTAPAGPEADGKRVVWGRGDEQALWSPNSDEFWEWTHRYIIEYAKMSKENKHIMGVFLDYENYAKGGESGSLYFLSYDDIIMGKFAKARGIDLPKLEFKERKGWLEKEGLSEAFSEFQINHWRERCRTLRKAVDEYDPTFQFCVYPAPGPLFMREAIYREWSTEAAPVILADPYTYGRPSRFVPEQGALEGNRKILQKGMAIAKEAGIPYIYAGGIDPVVRGADPEFCGKNAVMISEATDGYWIFYEGPKYKEDHPDYWKWFTWANKAIGEGRFEAQREARQTPENWALQIFADAKGGLTLAQPEITGKKVSYPPVKFRRENLAILAAKAGQPIEVEVRNSRLSNYESPLAWEFRTTAGEPLTKGQIPHNTSGTITFTPDKDGIYMLGLSAGPCTYSVLSSNVPLSFNADRGLGMIQGAERFYFAVPAGLKEFTLTTKGSGGETVRINVFNPDDEQVATAQTTPKDNVARAKVAVGDQGGKIWAVEVTKADQGAFEDNILTLDPKLPPVVSLDRTHVFGIKRK